MTWIGGWPGEDEKIMENENKDLERDPSVVLSVKKECGQSYGCIIQKSTEDTLNISCLDKSTNG